MKKSIFLKLAMGTILGGIAGYVFYYFIGCQGGCPLSSNWLSTTIFGSIFGFVLFFPDNKGKREDNKD